MNEPQTPLALLPVKGVVFDMDGVLIDSRDSNITFYNKMRGAVGLPPMSEKDEIYCHMATFGEALERIIPPALKQQAYKAAAEIDYEGDIMPMLTLQDGLIETLALLREYKLQIGIFTNRTNTVRALLHYFSIESFFDIIRNPLNCTPKPHPEGLENILAEWELAQQEIIFVGDSLVDQLAAQQAGVSFWAFNSPALNASQHIASFWEFNDRIMSVIDRNNRVEHSVSTLS